MTTARVLTRVLPLALAVTGCAAVAAQAQTLPWPSAPPQQQQPAAAPWPSQPAAPAAMPAPGGPGMMLGAPGPTPEQQQCLRDFSGYRQEVEKRAKAAEAEAKKKPPSREKMCVLVTAYSAAEAKWMKYSETNMARCGIPRQAVEQIKAVHTHTLVAKKNLCSPGPAQAAAPAAPSLSDALNSSLQPTSDEQSKHKVGGTMDTLTGPVLTR